MGHKTNFVIEGFEFKTSNPVGVNEFVVSFPYDIELIKGVYFDLLENEGDVLNVDISPNTLIGQIKLPAQPSASVIHVDSSVINYLDVGFGVSIINGNSFDDLGKCLSIDKKTASIVVQNDVQSIYPEGSYILMTPPLVRTVSFSGINLPIPIKGTDKTKPLPKNTPIVIKYDNKTTGIKTFKMKLEILF
jgi:hypothetical protein